MIEGVLIGLAEPGAVAGLLLVLGVLMALSLLFARALGRFGVPVVLGFMLLGMLGGSEGLGGIVFEDHQFALRFGIVALILILFDGGLNTSVSAIRRGIAPASMLATVGVVGTAGVMAVVGRLLGLSWGQAILVGAIVSSTDAAAVFAVLRGGRLRPKEKVRTTLEVESCVNDPTAVILTVAIVEALSGSSPPTWRLALEIPFQLLVGLLVGLLTGYLTRLALTRVRYATSGLHPVVTLASAFIAFGGATLLHGSGFLAVFAAAVVLGVGSPPYRVGLRRVHDAVAWLSQVGMFVMLGLLVFPSQLLPIIGVGLTLGLALAFVARPLVVWLCLLPFRFSQRERLYVSWVGIRGAVPIILASFPIIAGLDGAQGVFHLVFFIVVVSALVPGATIVPLTRLLRLDDPEQPEPSAALEVHSLAPLNARMHIYHIQPTVAACGATLAQVRLPEEASVVLIVRGESILPARGHTRLEAGDFAYVFCKPRDEPTIGLMLGSPLGQS
ncbi:MAG: potassium/proton antiporter [Phycisphaeraceae bacterium]|nr:potassium/proton antiporter [Phycisphaeraceae bacterium]